MNLKNTFELYFLIGLLAAVAVDLCMVDIVFRNPDNYKKILNKFGITTLRIVGFVLFTVGWPVMLFLIFW